MNATQTETLKAQLLSEMEMKNISSNRAIQQMCIDKLGTIVDFSVNGVWYWAKITKQGKIKKNSIRICP